MADELGPLAGLVGVWEGDQGIDEAPVLAGGSAAPDATSFELRAEVGSQTWGICSNPFLDREFRTIRYELRFEKRGSNTIHYREDTVLRLPILDEPFHHTDENTLTRVG